MIEFDALLSWFVSDASAATNYVAATSYVMDEVTAVLNPVLSIAGGLIGINFALRKFRDAAHGFEASDYDPDGFTSDEPDDDPFGEHWRPDDDVRDWHDPEDADDPRNYEVDPDEIEEDDDGNLVDRHTGEPI